MWVHFVLRSSWVNSSSSTWYLVVVTLFSRVMFLCLVCVRCTPLCESRQAANEAVEAALSSADADREEACAEATASMRAEVSGRDIPLLLLLVRCTLVQNVVAGESRPSKARGLLGLRQCNAGIKVCRTRHSVKAHTRSHERAPLPPIVIVVENL